MATLSFDGFVNIAVRIVQEKYGAEDTNLYVAFGTSSNNEISNPTDVDALQVVFNYMPEGAPHNETIIVDSKTWGEFGEPIVVDSPWLDCEPVTWPIDMDLPRAMELLHQAGYTKPCQSVTLRKPLYPGVTQPYFIFNYSDNSHVFVGVDDGSVTKHN